MSRRRFYDAARRLLEERVAADHAPVRLVGVGMSHLERHANRQQLLFDEPEHRRQMKLDAASDMIRKRFGLDALSRGSRLHCDTTRQRPPRPNDTL